MTTMKAAEKRAQAKVEYNAFLAGCPSRQLLERISDKWVVLILCALGGDNSSGRPVPRTQTVRSRCVTPRSLGFSPEPARRC